MAYSNWSPGQYIYLKTKITHILQSSTAGNNFLIKCESTYSFQCCGSCPFRIVVCCYNICEFIWTSIPLYLEISFSCSHGYNGFKILLPPLPHRSLCHKVNDLIKMSHLGKCAHSLQIVYLWISYLITTYFNKKKLL